ASQPPERDYTEEGKARFNPEKAKEKIATTLRILVDALTVSLFLAGPLFILDFLSTRNPYSLGWALLLMLPYSFKAFWRRAMSKAVV
ncbi:hypothetical protein, partial [Thermogladius sp.]|uniref:hypothetical protein n=1 Tax=Thermogladius sp. TaxID=2023064 RepID=UPI003D0F4CE3